MLSTKKVYNTMINYVNSRADELNAVEEDALEHVIYMLTDSLGGCPLHKEYNSVEEVIAVCDKQIELTIKAWSAEPTEEEVEEQKAFDAEFAALEAEQAMLEAIEEQQEATVALLERTFSSDSNEKAPNCASKALSAIEQLNADFVSGKCNEPGYFEELARPRVTLNDSKPVVNDSVEPKKEADSVNTVLIVLMPILLFLGLITASLMLLVRSVAYVIVGVREVLTIPSKDFPSKVHYW